MTPRRRSRFSNEKGMVLVYMAGAITVLLLFSGLAVDTGRIYIVKAQLTKALDGAALGAARNMNSGNPTAEAQRIFNANFPANFFGATLTSGGHGRRTRWSMCSRSARACWPPVSPG